MAVLIKIGNVDFTPYLTKYEVGISDLDIDSTRNTAGKLIRKRVAVKRKINLSFKPLTQEEIQPILNAIASVYCSIYYLDPQEGYKTKTVYVGDRTSPVACIIKGTIYWNGLSFDLIEQ